MPLIKPDLHSNAGKVRIRANAPDPFAGLRGRAYIAARKLNTPLTRPVDPIAAQIQADARENLIQSLSQRETPFPGKPKFVLCGVSGSMDFLSECGDRRFWPVHLPLTEEA